MYSPRFLLLVLAALCVVDAAILQSFQHAGRDLLDALNPTGNENKDTPTSGSSDSTDPTNTSSKSTPTETTPSSTPTTTTPTSSSTPTTSSTPTSTPTSTSVPTSTPTQPPTSSSAEPTSSEQPTSSQQPTSEAPSSSSEPPVDSTSTTVVTSTSTGSPTPTSSKSSSTPGLNSDKDSATSGMPPKTRNTIIGVVVGIGGAILLGAVGMVAYRIWGRRRHSEENDGLMSYDMGSSAGGYEKHEPSHSLTGSGSQRTPFQSTLENYHQPASNVNASSNF